MLDNINKKTVVDKDKKEWLCLRNIMRNDLFMASFGANYANNIVIPNNVFFSFQQKNAISRGYVEKELCSNNKLFSTIGEAVNCDDFIKDREQKFIGYLMATFFYDEQFTNSLKQKFGNKLNIQKYLSHQYDKKLVAADSILIEHVNKFDSLYDSVIKHTRYGEFFYAQGPMNLHLNFDDDKKGRLEEMLRDFNRSGYYNNREKNPHSMEYLRKMSCYMNVGFFENKYLSGDEPPSREKINFWLAINSFLNEEQKDYLSQIINANEKELTQEQKSLREKVLYDRDFQNKIISEWFENMGNVPDKEDEKAIKNGTFKINKQQLSFIMHSPEEYLNSQQKQFKDKFLSLAHSMKIEELRKMMDKSQPKNLESLKTITDLLEKNKMTFIPSCVKIIGDGNKDETIENISVREKNMPKELKNEIENCLFENEKKYLKPEEYSENHINYLVNKIIKASDNKDLKDLYLSQDQDKFLKAVIDGKLESHFSAVEKENRIILLEAVKRSVSKNKDIKARNNILKQIKSSSKIDPKVKNDIFNGFDWSGKDEFLDDLYSGKLEMKDDKILNVLFDKLVLYKSETKEILESIFNSKQIKDEQKKFISSYLSKIKHEKFISFDYKTQKLIFDMEEKYLDFKDWRQEHKNEWIGLRDLIFNKVFGAAVLNYESSTGDLKNIWGSFLASLVQESIEKQLCEKNEIISLEEAINDCDTGTLTKLSGILMYGDGSIIKKDLMTELNINNPDDYDATEPSPEDIKKLKSIIKKHINDFDVIKESILRHSSYYTFFRTQGPLHLGLNFDDNPPGSLEQRIKDFGRSNYYIYGKENSKSIEYQRLASCYMTVSFFENKYLTSNTPPSKDKINFWVAVNSYLNDDQRNYLSQIMNAKDNELTQEQKNLRDKILNDTKFRENVVDEWKSNFGKIPDQSDKETIDKGNFKINKQQLYFIMHAEESELNEQQKQFKNKFLDEAAKGEDNIKTVRGLMDNTKPQKLNNIAIITNLLKQEKIKSIPNCTKIIANVDDISLEKPVKNVSVEEKDMPEDFKNEINNCIFANEEKYLKFEEYSEEHKCHKINDKIFSYKDNKDKINEFLGKLLNSDDLSQTVKNYLVKKYKLEDVNDLTKSLARGKIEFNRQNAKAFLKRFYNKYKDKPAKGAILLKKICDDKKTLLEFKNFINRSIGDVNKFPKLNVNKFIKDVKNAENQDAILSFYLKSCFGGIIIHDDKIKDNNNKDIKNKNDSRAK